MDNKILVGVDGISYSGKTTFCHKVERLDRNIVIVDESPKFANIKIYISDDKKTILENSKTTLNIEQLRTKYVKDIAGKNIFLFDRTLFSFIAISYAYYKSGMVNYFNDYIDEIINGIQTGKYLVPDYLIYLSISENELNKRMKIKKKHLPSYWVSKEFNESINVVLEQVFKFYEKNKRNLFQNEFISMNKDGLSKIKTEEIIELLRMMKI